MQLHRISYSSRAVVEDPFKWAYTLEDHGYTVGKSYRKDLSAEQQEHPEFEKYQ
jgi:hypothetical protein